GIRDDLVTGVQTCALPISSQREDCQQDQNGGGRHGQREQDPFESAAVSETPRQDLPDRAECEGQRKEPGPDEPREEREPALTRQIGRASCREMVEMREGAV